MPIFSLPGDRMFQATGICHGKQRPPIMHAYGGAKVGMAQALQSIASEGWIPLAAAMVGTVGKKPMWADLGLRPVVGTTVDIKIWPHPLEHRELVLLLSCWGRWDHGSISGSAVNTWLTNVAAVKTLLTSDVLTLTMWRPCGYWKRVASVSFLKRTYRSNRSWRQ